MPLRDYDAFWQAYWQAPFPSPHSIARGPAIIPWFAVSSGTATGTTKYIPVSREMHRSNVRAGADLMTHHLANRPQSRVLAGRVFMLGGSTGLVRQAPGVFSGDISGIEASAMPGWARLRYFPPRDLEGIDDWQVKIDRFAERSLDTEISAVAGTPSWLLIYFERLAELAATRRGRGGAPDRRHLSRAGTAFTRRRRLDPPIATDSPPCSKAAARKRAKSIRRARGSSPSLIAQTARVSGCGSMPGSSTSSFPSISSTARTRTAAGSATSSRGSTTRWR